MHCARMKIRCSVLRKLKYVCLLISLPVAIVCFLKSFEIKKETYGSTTNVSRIPPSEYGVDCTAIYQLDPVEVGKSLEIRRKHTTDLEDEYIVSLTSDCQKYRTLRRYEDIHTSSEEQQFPLAYSIVVHKDAYMVERILRAIYVPHNIYCIHYDQKSSEGFTATMVNLARCLPNVFVASRLESVQYAHVTRLNADLNCLSDLLKSKVTWRYVINLCGQDFPLRSNSELVSELMGLRGGNMLESSRPSELKKKRFTFHHKLQEVAFEYSKLPVNTGQSKEPPPHGIEMFIGSAYFVVSREFASYAHGSPLAKDFLTWSEDTYSPDEHFWATLLRVPGAPGGISRAEPDFTDLMSKTRLVKWNYLEGTLYPPCTGAHQRSVCIYGAAELRWLVHSGHWFANKFDPKVDPVIIHCLEMKIDEKKLKHSGSRRFLHTI